MMRPASTPHLIGKFSKTLFVVAIVALVAFSVHGWRVRVVKQPTNQPPIQALTSAQLAEVREATRLEAEVVTLRPSGFEPAQISRADGRFLLAVDNLTGLEGLTLWLERASGQREQEVRLKTHRPRWRARLNLPAGNYVLRVAGHSDWVCRIRIGSA